MPSGPRERIKLDALRSFTEEVFRAHGVPARDAETAADLVLATAEGYKLPEPTRRADAAAGDLVG
jgi:deoxyinosine 3'endonuclease (endonuclease V)